MSLTTSHFIPFPREDVWNWHIRKGAVSRLTPGFMPMTPISEAERLSDGTTIFSLPAGLKWEARHDLSGYSKGFRFTDVCVNAPLRVLANWRHVHTFKDVEGGTMITDAVSTRVPGTALSAVFAYRQQQLLHDMLALQRFEELGDVPLTIAMTGSRGMVGRALTAQLRTGGHTVIQLVRKDPKPGQRLWDVAHPATDLLSGVDVLIHLAGEPIFGRFNDAHKKAIEDSRVEPTQRLAEIVAATPECDTMICASAIGFYGSDRGDDVLSEQSIPGSGFLSEVCQQWEAATTAAADSGTRVAHIRTGVALSMRGGLLPVFKTLFSTGLGGRFGDGSSWMSWIGLDDLTDIYYRAVIDKRVSGPINAVSPTPVRNIEFTKALGSELKRPTLLQIPSFGPKMLLGSQGAEELALANQRVVPQALLDLGHVFRHHTIDAAMAHELGREQLADAPAPAVEPAERKKLKTRGKATQDEHLETKDEPSAR